jgi:raffinose/stachyose/melibiose transport system substrate-binding protein
LKEVFERYGLSEPKTWPEFISICDRLKAEKLKVFAQGILDEWTLYEVVFSGLGANFYGGEKARQDLMAGRASLTDPNFLAAFRAINGLKPYFPKGYESIDYVTMQQLFGARKAVMFIGGSWELGLFEDLGLDPKTIGWFPPPVAKEGDRLQYCFQVDAGVAINKATKHPKEALEYIEWISGPEFAKAIMDEIPGFFSFTTIPVKLANPLAQDMFDTVLGADNTVRTTCEKLSSQSPSGNSLMGYALSGMLAGKKSPEEAAAYVQKELATWYPPFMAGSTSSPVGNVDGGSR